VPNTLERVIYRSRSRLQPDNVEELDKIFRASIRNNKRVGLTGCLAHPDGHFVQVIEGRRAEVASLMQRLVVDPRHDEVAVLGRWTPSSRIFSNWAMARPDLTSLQEKAFRLIDKEGSGAQITGLLLTLVTQTALLYPLL